MAEAFGVLPHVIERQPASYVDEMLAYFTLKNRRQERERKQAEAKQKSAGKGKSKSATFGG